MNTLLFVYGTLKRGCSNHHHLAAQTFVGAARTTPGFRLFDLGGYPGLAAVADAANGVTGEVWSVDPAARRNLDEFEGVAEGLYRRGPISLEAPFATVQVEAYFPVQDPSGLRSLGESWSE